MPGNCIKVGYESKEEARKDSKIIKANQKFLKSNSRKASKKHYFYECPYCKKWHITTQKPR